MEFFELMKARRSTRKFDPTRPVTDDQVDKILEAAIWAPSSGNTQCGRYFVVRDPKVKEDLALRAGHQTFIAEAPLVIVVCADLEAVGRSYGKKGRELFAIQDTAAAIENMLLAAVDLGLSSCWIGAFEQDKAAKFLGLKDDLLPVAMLPVGYSDAKPKPPPRKTFDELVKHIG